MSDFHVGQEVVCVDDSPHPNYGPSTVKLNRHYTVTAVLEPIYQCFSRRQECGIRVLEAAGNGPRNAFCSSRFRPIDNSKIEVFRRMCVEAKSGRKLVDINS